MSRPDVVLSHEERATLGDLAAEFGHRELAERIGVGVSTLTRAIAGWPVIRVTATALRAGLDSLVDGPAHHRVQK